MPPKPVVVGLREYGSTVVDGVRLSGTDRRLCASGQFAERIRIRELADDRLELTAGQYVGVVQLDACEIRIRPKYLGEELDVLRMVAYAADGSCPPLDALRAIAQGAPNLRDLVALLVAEHCERLLAHGVHRDYVTVEEDLPAVRGRLLADRQVMRHHGRLDRLACRFDEHDADVLDNRLCAAAVDLAARTARSPAVRARARRAAAQFAQFAPTPLGDPRTALARLDYHRHNEHYRPAHRWAALLLTGGGVGDLFAFGPLVSRAFLIDMNTLFESFATRLLTDASAGTGCRVRDQSRERGVLHDELTGRPYSEVRPDIMISGHRDGTAFRRPVDVKYKLYGSGKKLATADLYQAFLYAHSLAQQPDGEAPTCVLLHPGDRAAPRASVAVRHWTGGTSARVRSLPLELPSLLDALAAGGPGLRDALARVWGQALA
ncbi:McrC family protein [Streptomyces sp. NPDC048436]|uniref:McrC family protein n=1 Tax=Streptomyces sp. NPDC048436 TaxID=3365550 RepID=UPI0037190E0A